MLYFKYNLLNFPPAGRSLFHQFNFDTPTSEQTPSDPLNGERPAFSIYISTS